MVEFSPHLYVEFISLGVNIYFPCLSSLLQSFFSKIACVTVIAVTRITFTVIHEVAFLLTLNKI